VLLLIADDDREGAETLAELIRLLVPPPLEIVLAFDGKEALIAATGLRTPDVVLMDIEMPRMNGVDAAMRIRSALGSGAPILIAVTGHVGMSKIVAVRDTFDHALLKPVSVDELVRLF
jgi:two-component system response regulator MprA